jgi:hypothetical protein
MIGPLLHKLGLAILHQTADDEQVWVSTSELYSHIVTTLKKENNVVDQERVQRLFKKHFQDKEPHKVQQVMRTVLTDYRSGKGQ